MIKHNEFDINKFCLLFYHFVYDSRYKRKYITKSDYIDITKYTYKTDTPQKGYICKQIPSENVTLPWHCISGNSRDSNMFMNIPTIILIHNPYILRTESVTLGRLRYECVWPLQNSIKIWFLVEWRLVYTKRKVYLIQQNCEIRAKIIPMSHWNSESLRICL